MFLKFIYNIKDKKKISLLFSQDEYARRAEKKA